MLIEKITLPWPPSINRYWRKSPKGMYISIEGKMFRQFVIKECFKYVCHFNSNDRLSMHIQAYPPDKRKRDLDNIIKSLFDALEHARIFPNDEQIDKLEVIRMPQRLNKVVLTIDKI